MPATEAQIAAARRNGSLSRGPKSAEGKAISSRNALRHGLAGEGVVLAEGDAAEVDRRSGAMLAEMRPASEMGRFLVLRLARLTVRVERAGDQELAAHAYHSAHAEEAFDEARLVEVEATLAAIGDEPAAASRKLRSMPEGVERMVEVLQGLGRRLDGGGWDRASGELLCHLMGVRWSDPSGSGIRDLAEEVEAGDPTGRARPALAQGIDGQIARLREHAETLDHARIDADRAGAPARAGFDPSREATLARRYEAAASRELFKTLDSFRVVEAEARAAAEVVAPEAPSPSSPTGLSGSFRAGLAKGLAPTPRADVPATPSHPGRLGPLPGPRFEGSRSPEAGDFGAN